MSHWQSHAFLRSQRKCPECNYRAPMDGPDRIAAALDRLTAALEKLATRDGPVMIIAENWRNGECIGRWTDQDGPPNLADILPSLRERGWTVHDFREAP